MTATKSTQQGAEVLFASTTNTKATQQGAEVLFSTTTNTKATQQGAEVMYTLPIVRMPSNLVYPALPGIIWAIDRTPIWKTNIQTADSGKETRSTSWSFPIWEWTFTYELLRAGAPLVEYETLVGFFCEVQGQFESFRYLDPDDNAVTNENFGTGDAVTTAFQLTRAMGGFIEPMRELNGTPVIMINGVVQSSGFTISATGLVTFSSAPAMGDALTWTGDYYFRCCFSGDSQTFSQFQHRLWETKSVKIRSIK